MVQIVRNAKELAIPTHSFGHPPLIFNFHWDELFKN